MMIARGWILVLLLAACGAESEGFRETTDNAERIYEAGFLSAPLIDQGSSQPVTQSFSSGVFRMHRWKVQSSGAQFLRVSITTNNTFSPMILVYYTTTECPQNCFTFEEEAWVVPHLVDAATGRYEATMIMQPQHTDGTDLQILVTSKEVANDKNVSSVSAAARYQLQLLSLSSYGVADPFSFTCSLDNGTEESKMTPINLEYDESALCKVGLAKKAFVTSAWVEVRPPTGEPSLANHVLGQPKISATQEGTRYEWWLGDVYEGLGLLFGKDDEIDVIDKEDAVIHTYNVRGISLDSLITQYQAVDLRREYFDGLAQPLTMDSFVGPGSM